MALMSLTNWYAKRFGILTELWSDIRVLMKLRENSDPAETLKKIKERLDQTTKEIKDDKENS